MPGEGFDYTYDPEFNLIIQGFDVIITPSDQGDQYYHVLLLEQGAEVFEQDLPAPLIQEGETNEDAIYNVAQAAIDIFEADRGTLGEGAGAEMTAKKSMKKVGLGFGICPYKEEWFISFKGTPYEDMAYNLLKEYIELESEDVSQEALAKLHKRQIEIISQLKFLDLERLKTSPTNTKVIIIEGKKKAWLGEAEELQLFLDKFYGHPLESEVVKLLNEYIDLEVEARGMEEASNNSWESLQEIENQMEALSLDALQVNVIEKIPTSGLEAFPNMAGELAELMEGVEIDESLVSQDPFSPMASAEEMYKDLETAEERIEELGETHKGLDPAEVPEEDVPFEIGDEVSLSKELALVGADGIMTEYEKGLKGVIESLFDGHYDFYMVGLEEGGTIKVPRDHLKKS